MKTRPLHLFPVVAALAAIAVAGTLAASLPRNTAAAPTEPDAEAPPVGDGAVIVNTGSTNTAGYSITLQKSGQAVVQQRGGQARGQVAAAVATKFFTDLNAAGPLPKLAVGMCAKSVSFGTSTFVQFGGAASPDLSCPGDALSQRLWEDVSAIVTALHVVSGPRRVMIPLDETPRPLGLSADDNGGAFTVPIGGSVRVSLQVPPKADTSKEACRWSAIEYSPPGLVEKQLLILLANPVGSADLLLLASKPGLVTLKSHRGACGKAPAADWKVTVTITAAPNALARALPPDVRLTDVVSAQMMAMHDGAAVVKKTTVEQKLIELGAKAEGGKLMDAQGKEIRFFHLTGCWGNPPAGYQEIMKQQSDEIARLTQQYTVVQMTCNPSGIPIP